jgi:hypothetical protein
MRKQSPLLVRGIETFIERFSTPTDLNKSERAGTESRRLSDAAWSSAYSNSGTDILLIVIDQCPADLPDGYSERLHARLDQEMDESAGPY